MSALKKWLLMLIITALLLTSGGCISRVSASSDLEATATPNEFPPSPSPTPFSVQSTTSAPVEIAGVATKVPPLALTFAAPNLEPTPNWRPPLYPVPLALNPNDHFYFMSPFPLDYTEEPLPDYRYGYILPKTQIMHTGMDIIEPLHTPILAAADGKVVFAGYGLLNGHGDKEDPYGLAVVIRHNMSFQNRTILTVYAHMEKTTVVKGDWVKAGDQIGFVGLTGATSGPHLHFEIRLEINEQDYEIQNPELWMVPSLGNGVLAGRVMSTGGALLGERQVWVKSIETNKTWTMFTYSTRMTRCDPYYRENLVLSNLPAGKYEVSFYYFGLKRQVIEVRPGAIAYFQFWGKDGFKVGDPPPPSADQFLSQ